MGQVIDFKTGKPIKAETPVVFSDEGQLDWRFDAKKHPKAEHMVEIKMLVRTDSVAEIEHAYMSAWGRMVTKECRTA